MYVHVAGFDEKKVLEQNGCVIPTRYVTNQILLGIANNQSIAFGPIKGWAKLRL